MKATKARIERDSIEFQSQLLAGSLSSAAAKTLLDSVPPVESLMPPLTLAQLKAGLLRERQQQLR